MYSSYCQLDTPLPTRGLWAVSVPWHLVPTLAAHPNARQIAAELYLDPPRNRAVIVLWPGVDPRWVLTLLAKLERRQQRRGVNNRG